MILFVSLIAVCLSSEDMNPSVVSGTNDGDGGIPTIKHDIDASSSNSSMNSTDEMMSANGKKSKGRVDEENDSKDHNDEKHEHDGEDRDGEKHEGRKGGVEESHESDHEGDHESDHEHSRLHTFLEVQKSPSQISFTQLKDTVLKSANKNGVLVKEVAILFACPSSACVYLACPWTVVLRAAAGCVEGSESGREVSISESGSSYVEYQLTMEQGASFSNAVEIIESDVAALANTSNVFTGTGVVAAGSLHEEHHEEHHHDDDEKYVFIIIGSICLVLLICIVIAVVYCCCFRKQKSGIRDAEAPATLNTELEDRNKKATASLLVDNDC